MAFSETYLQQEPSPDQVRGLKGPVVIEFGTPWCGFCRAAQPLFEQVFSGYPAINHFKVEDGKGRRLGRAFGITLWPTLVFMQNGAEVARAVRPNDASELLEKLRRITAT